MGWIHVAWINVDAVIDTLFIRQRFTQINDEDMLKPSAIAETYWHPHTRTPVPGRSISMCVHFKEKF